MSEGAEIKISTKPKKVAGTARKRVGTAGVGKVVAAEGGATTKQLSVDATPLDPASVDATTAPVDTPVVRILGRVLEGISSVTHIIMGMLFSWAFGRLGWHVSWSILFMIVVYKWNERYMRAYAARRHEEFLREQAHKSVIAGDKETVIWLNTILTEFFPIYSPDISDQVEAAIIKAIDDNLKVPPPGVTTVEVLECSLGVVPPQLELIKTYRRPNGLKTANFQMDCTLNYKGDVRIVISIGVGTKLAAMRVPIVVRDLSIVGRLSVAISMRSAPPMLKTMNVWFKQAPAVQYRLEPGRAFDINSVPTLSGFLEATIKDTLSSLLVYPNKIPVELGETPPPGWVDDDHAAVIDEFQGILRLTVVSATGLRAADKSIMGSSSDPYAVVRSGTQEHRTPTVKKSLAPAWNFTCDLNAYKAADKQNFTLEVFDADVVGSDEVLGACRVDYKELVGEMDSKPVEKTIALQGQGATGEITVVLVYVSE